MVLSVFYGGGRAIGQLSSASLKFSFKHFSIPFWYRCLTKRRKRRRGRAKTKVENTSSILHLKTEEHWGKTFTWWSAFSLFNRHFLLLSFSKVVVSSFCHQSIVLRLGTSKYQRVSVLCLSVCWLISGGDNCPAIDSNNWCHQFHWAEEEAAVAVECSCHHHHYYYYYCSTTVIVITATVIIIKEHITKQNKTEEK